MTTPSSTRRRSWVRPVPTGRLAGIFALSALVTLILPFDFPKGLVVVDAVVIAGVAVDLALSPRPGRIGVERRMAAIVSLGERAELSWIVSNPLGRRLFVGIADELAPSLRPGTRRVRLRIGPHGRAEARTTLTPTRRGQFCPSWLEVRTRGPLGLAGLQAGRELPGQLRVYPSFGSRRQAELRIRTQLLQVGLRSAQGRGGGTDFEQLRDYGVDDDARRIDWSATARLARPIVRTYRAERNQSVAVLLDAGRTMAGQVSGVPRLEHGMDATLMVAAVASRLGDRMGLVAFDRQVRAVVPPAPGASQLARVAEALYRLMPMLAESDYRGAFVTTLSRFRRRALLCLLTELADQSLVETLLPALPMITRTHLVIVASVQDPQLTAWAQAHADTPAIAYRRAAAAHALHVRRGLAGRLRAAGATVIDGAPGRLGPELADAYLRAKATGSL
ncbi:MAG: DUF58 domain-containing protein [Acidimicrobiales bacterium]